MTDEIWRWVDGEGPLVAVAIHDGHALRDEVAALMILDESDRLREEDPYTSLWTEVAPIRVVGLRSRFEVDLNRSRERAVYREPGDAWGLDIWESSPSDELVQRSLDEYDAFYSFMHGLLERTRERNGCFLVYDLHSYNHRRDGAERSPADSAKNPQVNVGTGTMDRGRWGPIVDRFMSELRAHPFPGGPLDVRENVKFKGGNFARWVHQTFAASGCVLAIEFKKFFMDEWTGKPDHNTIAAIRAALAVTTPGVLAELARCKPLAHQ
jgi:hypothetical protein